MLNEDNASIAIATGESFDSMELASEIAFSHLSGNSVRVVCINNYAYLDNGENNVYGTVIYYSVGTQVPILTSQKHNRNG